MSFLNSIEKPLPGEVPAAGGLPLSFMEVEAESGFIRTDFSFPTPPPKEKLHRAFSTEYFPPVCQGKDFRFTSFFRGGSGGGKVTGQATGSYEQKTAAKTRGAACFGSQR